MVVTGTEQRVYGRLIQRQINGITHRIYVFFNGNVEDQQLSAFLTYPSYNADLTCDNINITIDASGKISNGTAIILYVVYSTFVNYAYSTPQSVTNTYHSFDYIVTSTQSTYHNQLYVNVNNGQSAGYKPYTGYVSGTLPSSLSPQDPRFFTSTEILFYFVYPSSYPINYVNTHNTVVLNNFYMNINGSRVVPDGSGYLKYKTGNLDYFLIQDSNKIPFVNKSIC